ncbi:L-type lectin-domain containing receptor kinase IX.1-like [Prunus yedoensis var. nudiflora]|uniref:L-type lectin-domain containing receptor kinase IX.1-like n=1 Tax=Prunus yedoensis var. nudiflora TaxID=2094558 RepID=A0A314YGB5_PRUYE|nr:L-type lectin-domain containing receptor kinase IX.1-like [Prunus yedoensis var. nudiflora]
MSTRSLRWSLIPSVIHGQPWRIPKAVTWGFDVNSVKSNVTRPWNGGIAEAKLNRAWISYNSSSKILSVAFTSYVNGSQEQVINSLGYMVDLNKYFPDWVIVGFSASTGAAYALHKITSWNFTSSSLLDDEFLAFSGQEKSQESPVPGPEHSSKKSRKRKKPLVVVISSTIGGGGGLILVCVVGLGLFNSCKKRAVEERAAKILMIRHDVIAEFEKEISRPRQFSYKELDSVTKHFAKGEKLGEGLFSVVYKGYLKDLKSYVAVKKISKGFDEGLKEAVSEMPTTTSPLAISSTVSSASIGSQGGQVDESGQDYTTNCAEITESSATNSHPSSSLG